MASISTADFKNGMCIINNGKMCTIVEFQHVKPGKGGAFVRTKLKDIKTGRVVDYTFNAGTKFDSVRLETKKMQYSTTTVPITTSWTTTPSSSWPSRPKPWALPPTG